MEKNEGGEPGKEEGTSTLEQIAFSQTVGVAEWKGVVLCAVSHVCAWQLQHCE